MHVINKSLCVPLLLLTLGISGCNGGGGGSSSSSASVQAPVYSGNTKAAVITTDNSITLAANVIGSSSTGLIVAAGIVAEQQPAQTPDLVQLGPRLSNDLRATLNRVASNLSSGVQSVTGASVSVNETLPCDLSGTVSVSGSLDDITGTGTLCFTFDSCQDIDGWLNGQATFRIDAYDAAYDFFTDTTISFTALQVKDTYYDVTLSGSLRSQVTIFSNREQLSGSYVARDNTSGELAKLENLAVIVDYNSVLYPSYYNLSILSGRIFDSIEGYVDVAATAPWFFATLTQDFPTSGGALVLTGANNARISVTPASNTLVKVELDLDANGAYELASTMPWTFLVGTPPTTNTAPTANAGTNQTVPKGTQVTLDGSGSSDPEYDFLTYQWTLAQRPNNSQASLNGSNTSHPTFIPDLEGNYVISLVVSDGMLSSGISTITITSINTAPVANAGLNQYATVGAQTSLDGSGSTDLNGDSLTYQWQLTLSPPGSNTQITDLNNVRPFFTPDLPGLYEARLTVSDGKLLSAADPVRIVAEKNSTGLCSLFGTNFITALGSAVVNLSDDFIPLCHGWVLLREINTNAIKRINIVTGNVGANYALSSAAASWELDADNAFLYVAHQSEAKITKINLITNAQTSITLSKPAVDLAVANNGHLFVILEEDVIQNKRLIALVNGLNETIEKVYEQPPTTRGQIAVYDRRHEQLILGDYYSLADRSRYSFNETSMSLTLVQTVFNAGTSDPGDGFIISPDGIHVAFPNEFFGAGTSISDISSTDLSITLGSWPIGSAYPKSMAFDPFGEYLAVIEDFPGPSGLKIFSVASHALLTTDNNPVTICDYNSPRKVRFSRDGKIIFSYSNCGSPWMSGKIYWSVFNL
jgi:hypothetical protein